MKFKSISLALLLSVSLPLSVFAFGQASPEPDLPNQTFGVFGHYDAFNTPHVTGGLELTKRATKNDYETIAVTSVSFQPLKKPRGALLTKVTIGAEQVVAHYGPFHFVGEGDLGVATSGTSTAGTFSAGGGAIYKVPPGKNRFFDYVKLKAGSEHSAITGTLGNYTVTFQKAFGN